jgi:hypothetical protein
MTGADSRKSFPNAPAQPSARSLTAGGQQANNRSSDAAISAHGRFVTFASDASNLVPGDTNNTGDVFVRDRVAQVTRRVSVG